MKVCFNCRKETEDSARFCPSCGADLEKGRTAEERFFQQQEAFARKAAIFTACAIPLVLGASLHRRCMMPPPIPHIPHIPPVPPVPPHHF